MIYDASMQLFCSNGTMTEIPVNAAEYEKVLAEHKKHSRIAYPYIGTNDCGYSYRLMLDSSVMAIRFRGHRRMDKQSEAPLHMELIYKAGAKIVIMVTKKEYESILAKLEESDGLDTYNFYSHDYFGNPYYIKFGPEILSVNATRETNE